MNILYIVNSFLLLFCFIQHVRGVREISPVVYLFLLVLIYLRSFVDIESVSDLNDYENIFRIVQSKEGFWDVWLYYEPGFALLEKILTLFTTDFTYFLVFYNIAIFTSFILFCKKYSISPYLSLILFVFTAFNQSIYVLRQWFAISLVLYSYKFIIERKLYHFLILSFLILSVHLSSIIWVPVYFLYNCKKRKYYLVAMSIATVFLFIAFGVVLKLGGGFYEKYAGYAGAGESAPLTTFFIQFLIFISSFFFLRGKILNKAINKLVMTVSFLGMVISVAGVQLYLVQRLALYYTVVNAIQIPNTANYIRNKMIRLLYMILVFSLFFIIYNMTFQNGLSHYRLK